MSEIKTIYFAGKVSKGGGYRGKLLGNSRVMSDGYARYDLNGGSLVYGGPFALCCDHGCFHRPGRHGLLRNDEKKTESGEWIWEFGAADDMPRYSHEDDGGLLKEDAVSNCLDQIGACDALHCFLETVSCYGTLVELGYAAAKHKPIYIYFAENAHNWDKHFWFCMNLPSVKHYGPGTETSIHPDLLIREKTYKERYHEYLQSEEWNRLRLSKLQEAGYRCQLCNKQGKLSVHHRTYDRVFHEDLADLIALCGPCHSKFHDIGEDIDF